MTTLPEDWRWATVGEVADTALGKMLDRGKTMGHAHVPYLRNVNVQWGRINTDDVLTMELAEDERERFGVRRGDLLVCEGGEVGRAAIWDRDGEYMAYQKALHRVRPHDGVDARYLRYSFENAARTGALNSLTTGSTIAHLPQQNLRRIPVPIPPLNEQRRIVEILEEHLSRLDAADGGFQTSARRLAAYRQALRQQAVDAPGSPTVSLASLISGVEAGKSLGGAAPPAGLDEWGIIKVSAMTWGEFRAQENKRIPAGRADPRYEIHPGDLLVSRANTAAYVGASVLVADVRPRLLLSDKSLRLVPRSGVNADWLNEVLQSPRVRHQITALATGTKESMRNISQKALLSVSVPNSSVDEQTAVIDAIDKGVRSSRDLGRALDAARRRSANLRRSLLATAFSGRLTGRFSDLDLDLEHDMSAAVEPELVSVVGQKEPMLW